MRSGTGFAGDSPGPASARSVRGRGSRRTPTSSPKPSGSWPSSTRPRAVSFVSRFGALGEERDLIAAAWDVDELQQHYRSFMGRFRSVKARDDSSAFAAVTRLVHEWRRFAFGDPVLPAALLPAEWSGTRAKELYDDRIGEWLTAAERWFRDAEQRAQR